MTSVAVQTDAALNVAKLRRWLTKLAEELGTDLFRYKGIVTGAGCAGKFVFQGVHTTMDTCFMTLPHKQGGAASALVFIGRHLDRDELERAVHECKAPERLRFPLGTAVACQLARGAWCAGRVTALWHQGYPYLVVAAGRKVLVPDDSDTFVRVLQASPLLGPAAHDRKRPRADAEDHPRLAHVLLPGPQAC